MKDKATPLLTKAGDTTLLINGWPPKVDCRVVAEEYYISMIHAVNYHDELVEYVAALTFALKLHKGGNADKNLILGAKELLKKAKQ